MQKTDIRKLLKDQSLFKEEAFINGHHKTKFDDENDNGEYFNKIYFKLKLIHFELYLLIM